MLDWNLVLSTIVNFDFDFINYEKNKTLSSFHCCLHFYNEYMNKNYVQQSLGWDHASWMLTFSVCVFSALLYFFFPVWSTWHWHRPRLVRRILCSFAFTLLKHRFVCLWGRNRIVMHDCVTSVIFFIRVQNPHMRRLFCASEVMKFFIFKF